MPDVGVLNLQIQENSEGAINGLDNLVDALKRVKDAVSGGLKLTPVANGLKKLTDIVNENVSGSTIGRLGQLADELAKLKGLGNINIKINGGSSIETILDAVRNTQESMSGINTGFDDIGQRATSARDNVYGFNSAMRETAELMQNKAWGGGIDQFREMFEQYARIRAALSLPAGDQTGISTQVENGWTAWKEGAIEVEGTVSDAMDTVTARLGEPIQYLTGMSSQVGNLNDYLGQTNDLMEGMARNTSAMSGGENAIIPYAGKSTIEEIRETIGATREATEETKVFSETVENAEGTVKAYYASLTDAFNGIRHGEQVENDLMSKWLHGEGTANEQMYALQTAAHMFGMTIDEVKAKVAELLAQERAIGSMDMSSKTDSLDQYTSSADGLVGVLWNLGMAFTQLRKNIAEAGGMFSYLRNGIESMFPSISGLIKRFSSIAKMRAIRYVIRQVTSSFREGIENLYHYSDAVGTSFAPAMDQAATALQQMKNSIGAAVAPAIQALIPILQTVVNWFITGINYLNQFFALLNGQSTWTRALPAQASAFEKNTDEAKKASRAMKELLADWDELNIIQSNSSSGSGSASPAATDYSKMFEEVSEYNDTIERIVSGIKDQFGDIWSLAKRIGVAVLGWKFSNAFSLILGTLGGLIGTAITIGLVFDISTIFTKNFLETGNAGWLVGDLVTTLLGGVLARKIMGKVLGGAFAKLAIPITFAVSAAASVIALVKDTDVSALSEKSILTAVNTALKGGVAAGALLYSFAGVSAGLSAAVGAGAALFTFGATIGIKATADVVDAKEITSETLAADFLSAGMIGAGLALTEAVLGGTIATVATVGLGGALFAFGALIAVQAIIANDKIHVQWGDYEATEKEIKAFVEGKVFKTSPDTILQIVNPAIEVVTTEDKELEAAVGEVKLTASKITIGYDVDNALKDLEKQIFGDTDAGTTGLIGQFKETAKAHQSLIETGITLVPTVGTNDDGTQKEILDRSSEAWKLLTGHMDDLGKELAEHMKTAYSDAVDEGTKQMELRTITDLTQMMVNVSAAITQGEQYEQAMLGLEANLNNLTKGTWSNMFDYISQYKEQVKSAYEQAYDATTISMAGQTSGLEEAWKNELKLAEMAETEAEKEAHLTQAKAYENEYKYWTDILEKRRAGRDAAIEAAANNAMNQDTVARIRKVLSGAVAKDLIDESDVRSMDLAEDMWTALFNSKGERTDYAERELKGWLDDMIDAAFGEDAEAIKEAIELGFLGYGDVIDQAVLEELAEAIGVNGSNESVQGAWKELVNKVFGNEKPEIPGLDDTALNTSASAAISTIRAMVGSITEEMTKLQDMGFTVTASYSTDFNTKGMPPVTMMATGGMPKSGDLVMANENGSFEMMGRMGSQPVVANNQQIVDGITQGVGNANEDVVSELRGLSTLMQRLLNKELVARAVPDSTWGHANKRSAEALDRVTG